MTGAGIYLHIPFCKQACTYCNFHFSTSLKLKDDFLDALHAEITMRSGMLSESRVDTIYFGGGTPSLLNEEELRSLLDTLARQFNIADDVEVTLEANPDDLSKQKLEQLASLGINRLSIGIQSFTEEDLVFMNRAHNVSQAHRCLEEAHNAGFDNMSIDLIYGTPSLTGEDWLSNLEQLVRYDIPHLAAYQLTVEPRTALHSFIEKGKVQALSDEKAVRQFNILMEWADNEDYEHYEISNLCRTGFRSKHNSSYWSGKPYLGLGPAAHSFTENTRSWNVANNAAYIKRLRSFGLPVEGYEHLSPADAYNEYVMTGLRRLEGVEIDVVRRMGSSYLESLMQGIERPVADGMAALEDSRIYLTKKGKAFADRIASGCFVVEDGDV